MTIDVALPLLMAFALRAPSESAPAEGHAPPDDSPPAGEPGALAGSCPPPCETKDEEEPGPWTLSASLGLAWSAGNSETLTADWNLLLDFRTSAWEWTVETEGLVVAAPAAGEDDTTEPALSYALDTRLEKRFTPLLGAYALVGGLVDHPAAIELRLDGEAGAAFTVVDRKGNDVQDWLLRADVGFLYSDEARREYDAGERDLGDVDLVSPALGFTLRCPVAERAKFSQSARILPDLGSSRVRFGAKSALATFLTEHLALATHLKVDFDSARAAGKEHTDVALTVGAEYDL